MALLVCGVCLKRKDRGLSCSYSVPSPPRSDGRPRLSTASEQQAGHEDLDRSPIERIRIPIAPAQLELNVDLAKGTSRPPLATQVPLAVDSMTGATGSDNHVSFGSSSASSFMMQIKAAIDREFQVLSHRQSQPEFSEISILTHSLWSQSEGNNERRLQYVLPSRKIADELTATYWDVVHPLFPFLDRAKFEKSYQSVWTGEVSNRDERILISTINAVFALGCQLTDTIAPEQRAATSMVYFKRAEEVLGLDFQATGSIELVQCLLLMGQYLQSTNAPYQCWMILTIGP
ncbi:hypothetical protein FOIG_16720 [Fusarium odoratissimum NRRL 54006]|uniref:Xylanolytic transcriptional activator regulatory domain-containing protein n=1 Tax=Fusarium odoratissimum (strain NRRL 54006) TaxID=1089451 RepID=X0IMC8_FUSO5|nr:uncharacterized protein FOIG_16720 [Fusarium odoratissimum NRRL 54006]EXL90002.1 hypothetical protein FOIG_16720 [Fusarium odoratissimum NRRL 54006]